MPDEQLSASAQRVQSALREKGYDLQVVELPASTRTAVEAAQAIGVTEGQIVKSLVFKTKHTRQPILALVSGPNRVDEKKIAALIGEPLGKADAAFVRNSTGFAIGGVPPLGHAQALPTFIDEDLVQYDEVWAAAGTPFAVFKLAGTLLPELTSGRVVDLKEA